MSVRQESLECDIVLPNARDDIITDISRMVTLPTHGQVGRFDPKVDLSFNPAPHQFDTVLQIIRIAITELEKTSLEVFEAKFVVKPTNDAPPVWPRSINPNAFGFKYYTFSYKLWARPREGICRRPPPDGEPIDVAITGASPYAAAQPHNLQVYDSIRKKWMLLRDWLPTVPEPARTADKAGWVAQRKWWSRNGKVFPIMNLPTEMRMLVFEHALGGREIYPLSTIDSIQIHDPDKYPAAAAKARLTFGAGCTPTHSERCPPYLQQVTMIRGAVASPVWPPNLSILQLDKETSAEAMQAGWEGAYKCFANTLAFTTALDARAGSAMRYNYLNKIRLRFTVAECFAFFGIDISYVIGGMTIKPAMPAGARLQQLSDAINFQLCFRSPDDGWDGSPWSDWADQYCGEYDGSYVCCQRTMVDWVMTLAFPFIKHIKRVSIAGAVKKASKQKWGAIFAKSTAQEREDALDQCAALAAMLNTPASDLPPRCDCRISCGVDHPHRDYKIPRSMTWRDDFDYEEDL